jgi:uncharacterized membrane protein YfcA
MYFELPELSVMSWAISAFLGMCVGAAKAGLPGVGLLVVPLMAELFPARYSTGVVLPMLIIADICAVKVYHRHADWHRIVKLLPPTLLGVGLGYLIMGKVDDQQFKMVVGTTILGLAVLMICNQKGWIAKDKIPEGHSFALLTGALVGVTTMMANAAGPIAAIYFLALRLDKTQFIGTSAWFFLIINLFKVPWSVQLGFIDANSLSFNFVQVPFIMTGMFIGVIVVRRLSRELFFKMVLGLTLFSATRMIFY